MTEKGKYALIGPEEKGECCYCGFIWVLRYSPRKCPHCGNIKFYVRSEGLRIPNWR